MHPRRANHVKLRVIKNSKYPCNLIWFIINFNLIQNNYVTLSNKKKLYLISIKDEVNHKCFIIFNNFFLHADIYKYIKLYLLYFLCSKRQMLYINIFLKYTFPTLSIYFYELIIVNRIFFINIMYISYYC